VKDWVCEDESDEIYPRYSAQPQRPPSVIVKAISKLLNKKTLDFETGYCRVAQAELKIGEKNSQSNLHNEKMQLMNRPSVAHDRIEP
jgi:hypothetical protein